MIHQWGRHDADTLAESLDEDVFKHHDESEALMLF